MNASTFTARVIASTLADMHSAITGAIAALKGPLHGGANEEACKMLEEIGEVDNAEAVDPGRARPATQKIMGFGHRVYKTEDPRATHLRRLSGSSASAPATRRWYEISTWSRRWSWRRRASTRTSTSTRRRVYHSLGMPTDLMTPIFALARMSGWTAHVREQHNDNRLIRPESEYIGPNDQTYVPIEDRAEDESGAASGETSS